MNFAKRELMKYGWIEGCGLGKDCSGIQSPVRQKLKFDHKGFGYKYGEEYSNNWWEKLYNTTAAKISVESVQDKSQIITKTGNSELPKTKLRLCKNKHSGLAKRSAADKEDMKKDKELSATHNKNLCNIQSDFVEQKCLKLKPKCLGKLARLHLQEELYLKNKQK